MARERVHAPHPPLEGRSRGCPPGFPRLNDGVLRARMSGIARGQNGGWARRFVERWSSPSSTLVAGVQVTSRVADMTSPTTSNWNFRRKELNFMMRQKATSPRKILRRKVYRPWSAAGPCPRSAAGPRGGWQLHTRQDCASPPAIRCRAERGKEQGAACARATERRGRGGRARTRARAKKRRKKKRKSAH